jgi:hypothetical protein
MSASERIKKGDFNAAVGNALSACVAVGGVYTFLIGASMMSGVLAVAGVFLGIWTSLVTDKPIISYLKTTYWGVKWKKAYSEFLTKESFKSPHLHHSGHLITIAETMREYYKMHNVKVRYWPIGKKESSFIQIDSTLLSSDIPVYVELVPISTVADNTSSSLSYYGVGGVGSFKDVEGKPLEQVVITPSINNVEGSGIIKWDQYGVNKTPNIRIYSYWEIWKKITKGKEYIIKVGIDPLMENQTKKNGRKDISKEKMLLFYKSKKDDFKI